MELPKSYDASQVEAQIYQKWLDSGYFNPDNLPDSENSEPFSIVMPPPNVTGTLHVGHALMLVIQDILIRFNRLQGKKALWLPGTDHAAIATQSKVEKLLEKEGVRKHELGREKFLERVGEFAKNSHDTIVGQVKAMGASCDWSREAYTLDAERSMAVKIAFKGMYDAGLISRGYRIVNWDPKGQTTISDDEIVYEERKAKLYTFKYSKDFPIAISTTRPETKVGDTAVAVHPEDSRYQEFIGKEYDVDFCGEKLHIKIVADSSVEKDFGTGALGVTPAHSQIDFEIAEKNKLPLKQVIDEKAKMINVGESLLGKKTLEAREIVAEWLRSEGLLEKEEEVTQNLSLAERTSGVIEPLPKLQWFVLVNQEFPMGENELGIDAGTKVTLKSLMRHVVESGQIEIFPDNYKKIYYHWIDNLRDWCISRQIWFGHRVPVWYDKEGGQLLPKDKKIYLARHAECEDNAQNILARPESRLTVKGKEQAQKLAEELREKHITKIITSTLNRAQETARLAAEYLGLTEGDIEIWPEVDEIHVGNLIGKAEDMHLHGFAQAQKEGTGESLESIEIRALSAIAKLENLRTNGEILVVAHGGFNAVFEAALQGRKKEDYVAYRTKRGNIPNASWVKLTIVQDPVGEDLVQDEDTLDTWFSSGLWTFSTLGWPNKTLDLKEFHPTTILETGYDILFFWVARMILMSTFHTGQVPFKNVFLHGMVRDANKQKMSKSKGNIIDPLDMIAKYGTDALRFALIFNTAAGTDMAISEDKIKGMKHFANKLWNIARFVITSLEASGEWRVASGDLKTKNYQLETLTDADKDILEKLNILIKDTTGHLENYRLHEAAQGLYQFTWHEFADVYIEAAKVQLQDEALKINTYNLLTYILTTVLHLLHPFMPFITEYIWGLLGERGLRKTHDPLLISKWPKTDK